MSRELEVIDNGIMSYEKEFNSISVDETIAFKKEATFAMQSLRKNSFLLGVATKNKESLKEAVINIASIGLSLNPALKHAYLVPRDREVVLDISYMGLIHLACSSGSIKWIQAEIVKSTDSFMYKGVGNKPVHEFDPFSERGEIVGCYTVTALTDGSFLSSLMTIKEIHVVREKSMAWKSFKSGKAKQCPWVDFEEEMIKKTVIKRAFKTLPKIGRAMEAVDYLNNRVGEGLPGIQNESSESLAISSHQVDEISTLMKKTSADKERFLSFFKVESLEEMTSEDAKRAILILKQKADNNV